MLNIDWVLNKEGGKGERREIEVLRWFALQLTYGEQVCRGIGT